MKNILDAELQERFQHPGGGLHFFYEAERLIGELPEYKLLYRFFGGKQVIYFDRRNSVLRFLHSSPGTETRAAYIDLSSLRDYAGFQVFLRWNPATTLLIVNPLRRGGVHGEELRAEGEFTPDIILRVSESGVIVVVEAPNAIDLIYSTHLLDYTSEVVLPTALEGWKGTVKAISTLYTGGSDDDFYPVVIANMALATIITGFETYVKRRYLEVEAEGVPADIDAVATRFLSKAAIKNGLLDKFKIKAKQLGVSLLTQLVNERIIRFQSYEAVKDAYATAYDIRFGESNIQSADVERLKKLIEYRHRIIHESPMTPIVNRTELDHQAPLPPSKELVDKASAVVKRLVTAIHQLTLDKEMDWLWVGTEREV